MNDYRSKLLIMFMIACASSNLFTALRVDRCDSRIKAIEAHQDKCYKLERILNLIDHSNTSDDDNA